MSYLGWEELDSDEILGNALEDVLSSLPELALTNPSAICQRSSLALHQVTYLKYSSGLCGPDINGILNHIMG